MQRRLSSLLVIGLASALVAGCGGRSGQTMPKLAHFKSRTFGIAFDYPASWRLRRPNCALSIRLFTPVVFVGAQPLHRQRQVRKTARATGFSCSGPIKQLRPGSVLVSVIVASLPTMGAQDFPGTGKKVTIAGRLARVETKRPGSCRRFKADETITAWIARGPIALYEVDACLRGPGLGRREGEAQALLSSIKLTRPRGAVA